MCRQTLRNEGPAARQLALSCHHLAITWPSPGRLFSGAALDFKTHLLHPNRAVNDVIAEKSYFALNGAMDRHGIRP